MDTNKRLKVPLWDILTCPLDVLSDALMEKTTKQNKENVCEAADSFISETQKKTSTNDGMKKHKKKSKSRSIQSHQKTKENFSETTISSIFEFQKSPVAKLVLPLRNNLCHIKPKRLRAEDIDDATIETQNQGKKHKKYYSAGTRASRQDAKVNYPETPKSSKIPEVQKNSVAKLVLPLCNIFRCSKHKKLVDNLEDVTTENLNKGKKHKKSYSTSITTSHQDENSETDEDTNDEIQDNDSGISSVECDRCHRYGHWARDCPDQNRGNKAGGSRYSGSRSQLRKKRYSSSKSRSSSSDRTPSLVHSPSFNRSKRPKMRIPSSSSSRSRSRSVDKSIHQGSRLNRSKAVIRSPRKFRATRSGSHSPSTRKRHTGKSVSASPPASRSTSRCSSPNAASALDSSESPPQRKSRGRGVKSSKEKRKHIQSSSRSRSSDSRRGEQRNSQKSESRRPENSSPAKRSKRLQKQKFEINLSTKDLFKKAFENSETDDDASEGNEESDICSFDESEIDSDSSDDTSRADSFSFSEVSDENDYDFDYNENSRDKFINDQTAEDKYDANDEEDAYEASEEEDTNSEESDSANDSDEEESGSGDDSDKEDVTNKKKRKGSKYSHLRRSKRLRKHDIDLSEKGLFEKSVNSKTFKKYIEKIYTVN